MIFIVLCMCFALGCLFIVVDKQNKDTKKFVEEIDKLKTELKNVNDTSNLSEIAKKLEDITKEIHDNSEEETDENSDDLEALCWFAENIPSKIQTSEEAVAFANGLNKIVFEVSEGHLINDMRRLSQQNKLELLKKLKMLNGQYITFKKISYRYLDEFIDNNKDILSEETIDKIKAWAESDIDFSTKTANEYFMLSNYLEWRIF